MSEPKKILVIDDEEDTVVYMEALLRDNGYQTVSANDGREGMEKAKSEHPDLIFLDVSMPQQSGIGFYKDIKSDPQLSAIPVVFVTGVTGFGGDEAGVKKFLDGRRNIPPPDGFFSKPIDPDALLKTVGEILG
jgi:CheY-like chemotaxis protein